MRQQLAGGRVIQQCFLNGQCRSQLLAGDDPSSEGWSAAPMEYREDGSIVYQVGGIEGEVLFEEASHD